MKKFLQISFMAACLATSSAIAQTDTWVDNFDDGNVEDFISYAIGDGEGYNNDGSIYTEANGVMSINFGGSSQYNSGRYMFNNQGIRDTLNISGHDTLRIKFRARTNASAETTDQDTVNFRVIPIDIDSLSIGHQYVDNGTVTGPVQRGVQVTLIPEWREYELKYVVTGSENTTDFYNDWTANGATLDKTQIAGFIFQFNPSYVNFPTTDEFGIVRNFSADVNVEIDWIAINTEGFLLGTEVAVENNVSVSPNPFSNSIAISHDSGLSSVDVNIYDVTGVNVLSVSNVANGSSIDVSSLSSGVYILSVEGENGVVSTTKIMK